MRIKRAKNITSPTFSNFQTGCNFSELQVPERVGEKEPNNEVQWQFSDAVELLLDHFTVDVAVVFSKIEDLAHVQ